METAGIARFVQPPVTVRPETPLDECARLAIRQRVRYLTVVDPEGNFLGLVADTDLFAHDALGEPHVDRALTAIDVLTPTPLAVAPDDSLEEVVRELAARRADVAAVVVGGRLVGVFTDEDAVRVAAEQLADAVLVQDLATRPVHTVPADAPAYRAWTDMLTERIRHVVVVDAQSRPIGVLSLDELAATGGLQAHGPTAGQLCPGHLETTSPRERARDAARRMAHGGFGCLPVLSSDGALVGIVTRTDLLWAFAFELEQRQRRNREPGPGFGYRKTLHGWRFGEALESVRARLRDEGFGILSELSFDAILKEKIGAELRPTVVLGACDPRLAVRALRAEREIGLLLPCHVEIFENEEGTPVVSVVEPSALLGPRADVTLQDVATEVETRLHRVVDTLVPRPVEPTQSASTP